MLLNVGSSTLATWVSLCRVVRCLRHRYAPHVRDEEHGFRRSSRRDHRQDVRGYRMEVFTGTQLDITDVGTMTSLFAATMIAAVVFWVSKIIVGFLSVKFSVRRKPRCRTQGFVCRPRGIGNADPHQ